MILRKRKESFEPRALEEALSCVCSSSIKVQRNKKNSNSKEDDTQCDYADHHVRLSTLKKGALSSDSTLRQSEQEKLFDKAVRSLKPIDQFIESAVFYNHYETTITNDIINVLILPIIISKNLHFNHFKKVYKANDFSLIHFCNKRGLPRIAYQQVIFKIVIELFVHRFYKISDSVISHTSCKSSIKDAAHVILIYVLYVLHQTQSPFENVASTKGASGNVMKMEEMFIKNKGGGRGSSGGADSDYYPLHPIRISPREFAYMNSFITYLMANKIDAGLHAIQLWHRMLSTSAVQVSFNSGPHGIPLLPPNSSPETILKLRQSVDKSISNKVLPPYCSCDDSSRFVLEDVSVKEKEDGGGDHTTSSSSSCSNTRLNEIFQRRDEYIKKQNKAVVRNANTIATSTSVALEQKATMNNVDTISPADLKVRNSSSSRKETSSLPPTTPPPPQMLSPIFDHSTMVSGNEDSSIVMDFFEFLNQPNIIPIASTNTRPKISTSNVFDCVEKIIRVLNFDVVTKNNSSCNHTLKEDKYIYNKDDDNNNNNNNNSSSNNSKVERVEWMIDSLKLLVF